MKNKKFTKIATNIVFIIAIISIIISIYIYNQLKNGITEISVEQQDEYIQLVVDQINVIENQTSEEIIKNILSSLSSSEKKYWVLSENESIVYVKNDDETNTYKNVKEDDYFGSYEAEEFINNLLINKVEHTSILINGNTYILSGTLFLYNGNTYKLCLMSDVNIFIENNTFLLVFIELITFLSFLIIIFTITIILASIDLQKKEDKISEDEIEIKKLNIAVEKLNDEYSKAKMYEAQSNAWSKETLSEFIDKLFQKKANCFTIVNIKFKDTQVRNRFDIKSDFIYDKNIIKFIISDLEYLFLFINMDKNKTEQTCKLTKVDGAEITKMVCIDAKTDSADYVKMRLGV